MDESALIRCHYLEINILICGAHRYFLKENVNRRSLLVSSMLGSNFQCKQSSMRCTTVGFLHATGITSRFDMIIYQYITSRYLDSRATGSDTNILFDLFLTHTIALSNTTQLPPLDSLLPTALSHYGENGLISVRPQPLSMR